MQEIFSLTGNSIKPISDGFIRVDLDIFVNLRFGIRKTGAVTHMCSGK